MVPMLIVDESMLRGAASCARDGVDGRFRRGIRREVGRVRRLRVSNLEKSGSSPERSSPQIALFRQGGNRVAVG